MSSCHWTPPFLPRSSRRDMDLQSLSLETALNTTKKLSERCTSSTTPGNMFSTLLTGFLGCAVVAAANDGRGGSTSLTAPMPGQTPMGDYSGQYRPQVHFSPPVVSAHSSIE